MNHSVNKWQQNKQKCIQGSLSGTERCDSWHLSSYRYSLSLVCLFTLSSSLSCTLHPLSLSRPQRVGDLEWALLQTALLPTARQGQYVEPRSRASFRLTLKGLPQRCHHPFKFMGTFENHSSQKMIGDYFLSQCWSQWKVHECSSQIN